MEIRVSLIAMLIAFSGGAGIVLLVDPARPQENLSGFAGTALVVGAGVLSLLYFCVGFFVHGASLRWIIFATFVVLLGLGAIRFLKQFGTPRCSSVGFLTIFTVFLVLGQLALVTWVSLYKADLGWDGLFVWEAKAHIAFRHGGSIPLQFFDSSYPVTHAEYPQFLPTLQVWIYDWLGHIDQSIVKLIGPYLYLAALLLLMGSTQCVARRKWLALIPVLLLPAVPMFISGHGSVSTGYSDFPLGVVWLCAAVHSMEFVETGSVAAAQLTGLSAMFLPFVKNDGAVALFCIAVSVLPKIIIDRNWRAGAWLLVPGFSVCLGWHVLLVARHLRDNDLLPVTLSTLIAHLDRSGVIIHLTIKELSNWNRWSILWPSTLVGALFLIFRQPITRWYPLVVNALLPLILYPCVFFFSSYSPFETHIGVALYRLFIQSGLPALLLLSTAAVVLFDKPMANESDSTARA